MRPPSHAPMKEPIWWDKKATPYSMDKKAGPKKTTIRPLVSGIVPSHNNPIEQPNKMAVSGVGGSKINRIIKKKLILK